VASVWAAIVRSGSVSQEQLRAHCALHLPPYAVPKRIRFVSDLPRTASGKLLRAELAHLR